MQHISFDFNCITGEEIVQYELEIGFKVKRKTTLICRLLWRAVRKPCRTVFKYSGSITNVGLHLVRHHGKTCAVNEDTELWSDCTASYPDWIEPYRIGITLFNYKKQSSLNHTVAPVSRYVSDRLMRERCTPLLHIQHMHIRYHIPMSLHFE